VCADLHTINFALLHLLYKCNVRELHVLHFHEKDNIYRHTTHP